MAALEEDTEESQLSPMSRKEKMEALAILLGTLLIVVVVVDFAVRAVSDKSPFLDKPARYSVELVATRGIGSALGPGAAESPAFELLVHVDNRHAFGLHDGGSDIVVSYAGVPLARGRSPAFDVEAKRAVTVGVNATSRGVGIPDELFRLMVEERRSGATPQLRIDLWLDLGLLRCSVELDGEPRASRCDKVNFIYSS